MFILSKKIFSGEINWNEIETEIKFYFLHVIKTGYYCDL